MIHQDTLRLLRECDAGASMGTDAIRQVLPHVSSPDLKARLEKSKTEHEKLTKDIAQALHRFGDEGKAPNTMAKAMSTIKTGAELFIHEDDKTVSSLITDGCNMGVKSLNRYLNEFEAADEHAKDICKRLIALEQALTREVRDFL